MIYFCFIYSPLDTLLPIHPIQLLPPPPPRYSLVRHSPLQRQRFWHGTTRGLMSRPWEPRSPGEPTGPARASFVVCHSAPRRFCSGGDKRRRAICRQSRRLSSSCFRPTGPHRRARVSLAHRCWLETRFLVMGMGMCMCVGVGVGAGRGCVDDKEGKRGGKVVEPQTRKRKRRMSIRNRKVTPGRDYSSVGPIGRCRYSGSKYSRVLAMYRE